MPTFNAILLDLPDQLTTERLLLRPPSPGDGPIVHAAVLETLSDLRRFPASMIWAMSEQTLESAEEWCRRGAAGWLLRNDFPLIVFRRTDGQHVGQVGLHRFDWERRVFEIGWWCRQPQQGRGYITEAAAALVEFAFAHLGARRVWCFCDEHNARSWRVAERLGFVHEGTTRSDRADPDGTRRDMRQYAVVR